MELREERIGVNWHVFYEEPTHITIFVRTASRSIMICADDGPSYLYIV